MSNGPPSKVDAYFTIIDNYVIAPITTSDFSKSCIATLLLIFASVDGLGFLTYSKARTDKAGRRFKYFLNTFMSRDYAAHRDQIYDLRCQLAHNALGFASFMSYLPWARQFHLKMTPAGYLIVSTEQFASDFCIGVQNVKRQMKTNAALRAQAERRLNWVRHDPSAYWSNNTTPPGPVEFITI